MRVCFGKGVFDLFWVLFFLYIKKKKKKKICVRVTFDKEVGYKIVTK